MMRECINGWWETGQMASALLGAFAIGLTFKGMLHTNKHIRFAALQLRLGQPEQYR